MAFRLQSRSAPAVVPENAKRAVPRPQAAAWKAMAWRTPARAAAAEPPGRFHYRGPPGLGTTMDVSLRASLEQQVGADLSDVHLHDGPSAAAMAARAGARAFTVGKDIVFGAGELNPVSSEGRRLLAHEAAHAAANPAAAVHDELAVSHPDDAGERQAEHIAAQTGGSNEGLAAQHQGAAAANASSGSPMLQRAPIKGNTYGDYDVVQTTHDGASATDFYWSPIAITFNPNVKTVDSSEIAFVQTVRKVDSTGKTIEPRKAWNSRETKDHSRVDAVTRSGWVGYDSADKPYSAVAPGTTNAVPIVEPGSAPTPLKAAVTRDWPTNNVPSVKFDFESAAIAKAGKDKGKIYGAISWGFDVNDKNKLSAHTAAFSSTPSKSFTESVAAWNVQAAGPEADRMVTDQAKLGPFK